jgi:catechol 2,3-dioxygenase-like lactoylglutathione lyase family enzyme
MMTMKETKPLGSPARSILIRAERLDAAKLFYQKGLGLQCVGETETISDELRRVWGLGAGDVRMARLACPGDPFGAVDLIEWVGSSGETIRDPKAPFDYGWLTINWLTGDMTGALSRLAEFGAQAISSTKSYEAGGRTILETMIDLPTGERCTLLQVGDTIPAQPPFGKGAATIGVVVESVEGSLPFYRDLLGLRVAVTIDHTGEPFSSLVGAPSDSHLKMNLLAGTDTWTGKLELLEFSLPNRFNPRGDANARADGSRTGYWMVSLSTPDIAAFCRAATQINAKVKSGASEVEHPFIGKTRVAIVAAPGGELFEVYEAKGTQ